VVGVLRRDSASAANGLLVYAAGLLCHQKVLVSRGERREGAWAKSRGQLLPFCSHSTLKHPQRRGT